MAIETMQTDDRKKFCTKKYKKAL